VIQARSEGDRHKKNKAPQKKNKKAGLDLMRGREKKMANFQGGDLSCELKSLLDPERENSAEESDS